MFTHFLITRFNIQIRGKGPENIDSPDMDATWLSTRLHYFEAYCSVSICKQTNKNFQWLIYCDPHTDPQTISQLKRITSCGIPVEITYARHFDDMLIDLRHRIAETGQPYIITSRIDNDDMVSFDFIDLVQKAFTAKHNTLINFNAGYELDVTHGVLKKWNKRFLNQFISLVEKTSPEAKTVYGFPHYKPPAGITIHNIDAPPAWIYLRHANNYSAKKNKGIPVILDASLDRFPVQNHVTFNRLWHTMLDGIGWFPGMVWRRIKRWISAG